MVDPTETEIEAIQYAGQMGGEYLDSLNKPAVIEAFATMTQDEYLNFVEVIITGFTDKMVGVVGGSDPVQ